MTEGEAALLEVRYRDRLKQSADDSGLWIGKVRAECWACRLLFWRWLGTVQFRPSFRAEAASVRLAAATPHWQGMPQPGALRARSANTTASSESIAYIHMYTIPVKSYPCPSISCQTIMKLGYNGAGMRVHFFKGGNTFPHYLNEYFPSTAKGSTRLRVS